MSVALQPPCQQNMPLFQFIPPPLFSPPLSPSPIYSPLLLSPPDHPIPQTNQFACLLSILLSMPAPTLSFVLCRDLHFQQPRNNLSFMPPSINPPIPHTPLKGVQSIDFSDNAISFRRKSLYEFVKLRVVGRGVMESLLSAGLGRRRYLSWE